MVKSVGRMASEPTTTDTLRVPGYEVGEAIHEGATYRTYHARRDDGVEVVLKAPRDAHPGPAEIAWLRREYAIHSDLDVPGVVKAYGLENHGWVWALVLEDFGGQSLDRLLPTRPWSLAERLGVAVATTAALGQLHARNIIHKDITPANVVWNPTTGVLKIVDLSISTVLSRESAAAFSPGELEGTLPYLSPEQTGRVNRDVDFRADFYSLGATLYELFTGRRRSRATTRSSSCTATSPAGPSSRASATRWCPRSCPTS